MAGMHMVKAGRVYDQRTQVMAHGRWSTASGRGV
jgi:hypothetical protein